MNPAISEHGFHFLLMDRASQVWSFIQLYLDTVEVCMATNIVLF